MQDGFFRKSRSYNGLGRRVTPISVNGVKHSGQNASMPRRGTILAAYFVLGALAVCAQATLLREAQVILLGSELSWGLVLAFWLVGVAAGAHVGGRIADRPARARRAMVGAALAIGPLLAAAVALVRGARPVLDVGPGEYVGLAAMIGVAAAVTVPVSVWVGLAFPAASALVGGGTASSSEGARAVGRVYLAESAGSLVGGALFSFVLVTRVDAFALALGGGAAVALAVAPVAKGGRDRLAWVAAGAATVEIALVLAGGTAWLSQRTAALRWESFAPGLERVRSADTPYQNAALGRLAGQSSLYLNGTVAATWPNPYEAAIETHLMACQCPAPRRILLAGGGLEGRLAELLRHGPEQIDVVQLDREAFDLARPQLPETDRAALADRRVRLHFTDARRFVKRAEAGFYDLLILATGEPTSILEARMYTPEFFADAARALSERGVLAFALEGSVGHWGPEVSHYVGSIALPLEAVFPHELLTYGDPVYAFAAKGPDVLAATGEALAVRYEDRGVASPHFHPNWFRGASDLLDPTKRRAQRQKLAEHPPRLLNTDDRPAAAVYHMILRRRTSDVAHTGRGAPPERRAGLLDALLEIRFGPVVFAVLGAMILAGLVARVRGRRRLARAAVLWSVGTTGFASMALEIVLLATFQTLYGYVYSMVGLVIGTFMFGLVVGSLMMNLRLRRGGESRRPGLRSILALDMALAVFAAGLVLVLAALRAAEADWAVQVAIFALVAASGVLGGLVFPLAAAASVTGASGTGRAAGAIDAADHAGACLGALVTGVALVPVLGISGTCLVVAAMKAASALLVGTAVAQPIRPPQPSA